MKKSSITFVFQQQEGGKIKISHLGVNSDSVFKGEQLFTTEEIQNKDATLVLINLLMKTLE